MIEILKPLPSNIVGAVFDMDDTLLDNQVGGVNIHTLSRLEATHQLGRQIGHVGLQNVTLEDSVRAFSEASEHTTAGAAWNILRWVGLVDGDIVNNKHCLIKNLEQLKLELHEGIMLKKGQVVPQADLFVESFHGEISDKIAIATGSYAREVRNFFKISGLEPYFEERFVSKEMVKRAKPDKEPFNKAFHRLGLNNRFRSSVLAFEDDPLGVASATAAGLVPIAITTRHNADVFKASLVQPAAVADSYKEIANTLNLNLVR